MRAINMSESEKIKQIFEKHLNAQDWSEYLGNRKKLKEKSIKLIAEILASYFASNYYNIEQLNSQISYIEKLIKVLESQNISELFPLHIAEKLNTFSVYVKNIEEYKVLKFPNTKGKGRPRKNQWHPLYEALAEVTLIETGKPPGISKSSTNTKAKPSGPFVRLCRYTASLISDLDVSFENNLKNWIEQYKKQHP